VTPRLRVEGRFRKGSKILPTALKRYPKTINLLSETYQKPAETYQYPADFR